MENKVLKAKFGSDKTPYYLGELSIHTTRKNCAAVIKDYRKFKARLSQNHLRQFVRHRNRAVP